VLPAANWCTYYKLGEFMVRFIYQSYLYVQYFGQYSVLKTNESFIVTMYFMSDEQGGLSGNVPKSNWGGARFESRPGYRLSLLFA
jgi:hypothetical protein